MFKKDSFGLPLPTDTAKFVSKIRMTELGREYQTSVKALESRLKELTGKLKMTPPKEKPDIEQRISILRREIAEARRTGADASGFYTENLPMPESAEGTL